VLFLGPIIMGMLLVLMGLLVLALSRHVRRGIGIGFGLFLVTLGALIVWGTWSWLGV